MIKCWLSEALLCEKECFLAQFSYVSTFTSIQQHVVCPKVTGFDHTIVKIIKIERAECPSEWIPDVAMGISQKHNCVCVCI